MIRKPFRPETLSLGFLLLSVAATPSPAADPPPYYFTTLAGAASTGTTDGTGTAARFASPRGLAVDRAGNLYVADSYNFTVRRISPAGAVSTLAGKPGTAGNSDGAGGDARFGNGTYPFPSPCDLVCDSSGNVYLTDQGNFTIRKVTPAGVVSTLAGLAGSSDHVDGTGSAARFRQPGGIAIDASGNLLVLDEDSIRKVTATGVVTTVTTLASAPGVGGMAIDPSGNLFIPLPAGINKVAPDGSVSLFAGSADFASHGSADGAGAAASFNQPLAVASDSGGNIFVTDTFNQTIRKITPDGLVTTLTGIAGVAGDADGPPGVATFSYSAGITVDSAGNLFVSDGNVIRKITPAGLVSTLAGLSTFQSAGSADGVGPAARFNQSEGVAVTRDGTCYVADTGNHVIRRILPTGEVTTLAGAAGQAGFADGDGPAARFDTPFDLAVDAGGNLYVIDASQMVRKVTSAGVVSTLSGTIGTLDSSFALAGETVNPPYKTAIAVAPNGDIYLGEYWGLNPYTAVPAGVARFSPDGTPSGSVSLPLFPHSDVTGLAFDAAGTLYVCDPEYHHICKVPAGATTAIEIRPNIFPNHVAVDQSGQVFLTGTDIDSSKVFRLADDGTAVAIAGRTYHWSHQDGVGSDVFFASTGGIAVDGTGALYVTGGDNTIRKGVPAGAPTIMTQPQGRTVAAGDSVQFTVAAAGVPDPTYQWYFNGGAFSGATTNSLGLANVRSTDAGDYTVVVTNAAGSVTSAKATLAISAAPTTPPPSAPAASGGGGGAMGACFASMLLALGALRALAGRPSRRH